MSMELGSTKWTSNNPHPFSRAPGGGMGALHETGFAAQDQSIDMDMDSERILAKGPFKVQRLPVTPGDIPSMLISFRYTDRGSLTKQLLDAKVKAFLQKASFRVSKSSSFKPVDVTWKWGTMGKEASGDVPLYVPVVASPGAYEGLRYSGNLFSAPLYAPDAKALAPLPNQIWVYTMVITSQTETMSDGESAQALTLLKQAMINMSKANAYATVLITLRGCPRKIFGPKSGPAIKKAGWDALLLLVAYNMIVPHFGSEVL